MVIQLARDWLAIGKGVKDDGQNRIKSRQIRAA
jgi:hypothetical protein